MIDKHTFRFICMTTPCEVVLYAESKETANKIRTDIEANSFRLEKKYNFYSNDSLVSAINNRKENRLTIDEETRKILVYVRELSIKTNELFDITIGTLKQCFGLGSIEEVEACRQRLKNCIGLDSWSLEGNELVFSDLRTNIDLGGVIKEYAVDQAGLIARQAALPALINFGGDIYANSVKPDGQPFNIAIKNPKNTKHNLAIIKIKNQGLATSADYERGTTIEGRRFSHIIGDKQGELKILSTTVISGSVLTSGIYSTSLMLNPALPVSSKLGLIFVDDQLRLHQNIYNG